ncbi:hypothetical protein QYF61_007084 [Mycteria americana]|uniref:Uncharacterized protein n=1 Tax=Mycteria americana TaxID=33587 RepID=A0AAN7S0K3_MYCAM|nr:hypothetical protein QYF61_007084 [Mycteria americana]
MKFNKDKSEVLHLRKHNPGVQHKLGSTWLGSSSLERDLGVLVDNKLNMSEQCAAMAKKAKRMLGCINKGISSRDKEVIIPFYPVLVRPHLEHCVQFWSLLCKKDVGRLEKVQRRATKMIKGLGSLPESHRMLWIGRDLYRDGASTTSLGNLFQCPTILIAEQPQLSQPVLVGEVLQPSDHFLGPPLDLLQQLHVVLVLRVPELDAGLQVPLDDIPSFWRVNCTTQLGVICKLPEGCRELGSFSLVKRRLRGDLITVFQYLKDGYKEDGDSLFTRSHMEKTRGKGYKLLLGRF